MFIRCSQPDFKEPSKTICCNDYRINPSSIMYVKRGFYLYPYIEIHLIDKYCIIRWYYDSEEVRDYDFNLNF